MDVTLRDLRYFLALADEQHLTRAAERLSVAPATLSEAIKRLESATGLGLFERTGRSIELSDDGRALVGQAAKVLSSAERLDQVVAARSGSAEKLRVGVSAGYGALWLHGVQRQDPQLDPPRDIEIVVAGYEDPTAGLRAGTVHASIIGGPCEIDHQLDQVHLGHDPRMAAIAESHPASAKNVLTLAEIDDVGWLDVPQGDRAWHLYWRGDHDRGAPPPRINRRCSNVQELQYGLMGGEGICTVPRSLIGMVRFEGVVFIPVVDLEPAPVRLVYPLGEAESQVLQQLGDSLRMIAGTELLPVTT